MRIKWSFVITMAIVLTAVALRFALAWKYPGNYDQESYGIVSEIMERGGNIYAETERYNYSPVWSFFLHGLKQVPVRFHFAIRSFLTLIDIVIAWVLYRITGKKWIGFSYLANPVTILLTGYHGQFENLAMLPLLAAVYMIEQKPRLTTIWVLGTLSLLVKHITLFFVLFLFLKAAPTKRRAVLMMLGAGLVLLASFLPYLPEGRDGIIQNVVLYASYKGGSYGLSGILPGWGTLPFMTVMTVTALLVSYSLSVREGLAFMVVAYLALAPGVGEQAFILPMITAFQVTLPFLIFSTGAFVFLAGSPNNISILPFFGWNAAWVPAVSWFIIWSSLIAIPNAFSLQVKNFILSNSPLKYK